MAKLQVEIGRKVETGPADPPKQRDKTTTASEPYTAPWRKIAPEMWALLWVAVFVGTIFGSLFGSCAMERKMRSQYDDLFEKLEEQLDMKVERK